jgi:hypothetical protein
MDPLRFLASDIVGVYWHLSYGLGREHKRQLAGTFELLGGLRAEYVRLDFQEVSTLCLHSMFSPLGLFRNLPCPQLDTCTRQNCLYSHSPNTASPRPLNLVPHRQPVVFLRVLYNRLPARQHN